MLIGRAEQAVGPNRAKIREWIASVGRSQPAYLGATGEIRFDDTRNPVDKPALVATVAR
jgi:ABC-type branched-subunit amino acid transport system substrate-binding protein